MRTRHPNMFQPREPGALHWPAKRRESLRPARSCELVAHAVGCASPTVRDYGGAVGLKFRDVRDDWHRDGVFDCNGQRARCRHRWWGDGDGGAVVLDRRCHLRRRHWCRGRALTAFLVDRRCQLHAVVQGGRSDVVQSEGHESVTSSYILDLTTVDGKLSSACNGAHASLEPHACLPLHLAMSTS